MDCLLAWVQLRKVVGDQLILGSHGINQLTRTSAIAKEEAAASIRLHLCVEEALLGIRNNLKLCIAEDTLVSITLQSK